MGWGLESVIYDLINLWSNNIPVLLKLSYDVKYLCLINEWDPAQSLEDHVIKFEEIKIVVESFLFHNKPSHELYIWCALLVKSMRDLK